MKSASPLSKREWIFLIVILLLIQFMVHWLSLRYGSSISALGYVSFAGTVVSILLGLIAIIYAFVQSFTQASSVVEIREQIDKLIVAGDDIVKSKDDLHQSAMELGEITNELSNKINESILATKEVAGSVVKLSDAFSSQIPPADYLGSKAVAEVTVGDKCLSVFDSTRTLLVVAVGAIAEGVRRGFTIDDIKDRIAIPVGEKLGHHAEFMGGMLFMAIFTLEAEGFISIVKKENEKWELTCAKDFLERMEKTFPRATSGAYKELVAFWSIIDELD